jgi:tellurite resistance protein
MSKKRKRASVPKRIAGVKVPKSMRRGLKNLGRNPQGRKVVADALLAAGAAIAASQSRPGSATRRAFARSAPQLKTMGKETVAEPVSALGLAFEAAAEAFAEAIRHRKRDAAAPAAPAPTAP